MKKTIRELQTVQVSDLCRRKLLNYADGLYELARNCDCEETPPDINEDRQKLIWEGRLRENRLVMKYHFREMAKIMTETACEVHCLRPLETRKAKMICRLLPAEGILAENPCCIVRDDGSETIAVTMSLLPRLRNRNQFTAGDAADMIGVILNRRLLLSGECPLAITEEPHTFLLEPEPDFVYMTGFAKGTKEGETVSGDTYSVFEPACGKVVSVLSDGTGAGEKAGETSGQVIEMLEKFLEAGYGTEAAIQMLNSTFFLLGEDDNHPTLDICELDLYTGLCEIRKVGGAASFVKSGSNVEKLMNAALPLGIFRKTAAEPITRYLQDGDYLIQVTDGVVDAFGEQAYEDAMCNLLSGMRALNPTEMAEKILRSALYACGGHVRDDMTVGVIGFWERK